MEEMEAGPSRPNRLASVGRSDKLASESDNSITSLDSLGRISNPSTEKDNTSTGSAKFNTSRSNHREDIITEGKSIDMESIPLEELSKTDPSEIQQGNALDKTKIMTGEKKRRTSIDDNATESVSETRSEKNISGSNAIENASNENSKSVTNPSKIPQGNELDKTKIMTGEKKRRTSIDDNATESVSETRSEKNISGSNAIENASNENSKSVTNPSKIPQGNELDKKKITIGKKKQRKSIDKSKDSVRETRSEKNLSESIENSSNENSKLKKCKPCPHPRVKCKSGDRGGNDGGKDIQSNGTTSPGSGGKNGKGKSGKGPGSGGQNGKGYSGASLGSDGQKGRSNSGTSIGSGGSGQNGMVTGRSGIFRKKSLSMESEAGLSKQTEPISKRKFLVLWDYPDEDCEEDIIPFCNCCRPVKKSEENCCKNDSDNDEDRGCIPDFGIFRKITVESKHNC